MRLIQILYGYSIVIDLLAGILFVFSQIFLTTPRLVESFIVAILFAISGCQINPSANHPLYPFAFEFSVRPFLKRL